MNFDVRLRLLAIAACCALPLAGPARADFAHGYISAALQGDISAHVAAVDSVEAAGDSSSGAFRLAAKLRERFIDRTETFDTDAPPFLQDLLTVYRDYWTQVLLGNMTSEEGEEYLRGEVGDLLAQYEVPEESDTADVFDRMGSEIERQGYYYIGGRTLPYMELMLWSNQDTTEYDVELTDKTQSATVVFLTDFASMGWAHFATFGRAYSGGWATREALFCLKDDYDLDSEKFKISYLKHEGRHFADYSIFPNLQQIDLEYRGKLTELIYADESLMNVLKHFRGAGSPNPESPHAYANWAVARDLSAKLFGAPLDAGDERWDTLDPEAIHAAARELL
ncbi:MAG: hypothetical protein HKN20_02505, partial [Gemmatimonadetes bacterium]|nr:hypothetical protein [Gemmatimonadota bacterium]